MELKPNQAVALWRMLTAETDEVREPMWSKIRPKISADQRKELVQHGLVVSTRRGRANHLVLTQKAWIWAQESGSVELGRSVEGTAALQALLRRLLPFLKSRSIQLLDILGDDSRTPGPPRTVSGTLSAGASSQEAQRDEASAQEQVLRGIRTLAQAAPAGGVRLAALRKAVPQLTRKPFDDALLSLGKAGLILLYPDDDRASLTLADHEAALVDGETARHLVYLENR